jgi:hypothetical protein
LPAVSAVTADHPRVLVAGCLTGFVLYFAGNFTAVHLLYLRASDRPLTMHLRH